jgi:hypothetical protein
MKEVFEIDKGREQEIKKDGLLSRQSLTFRDITGKYYLIIDGTEEAIKKLKEGFNLKISENKEKILEEFKKQEEKAVQGFGNIFG